MKTSHLMANQNWSDMTIGFLFMIHPLTRSFLENNIALFGVADYMPHEVDSINFIRNRMTGHFYTLTTNWLSIMEETMELEPKKEQCI